MEITITQSGGVAGLTKKWGPVNTETLPQTEAQKATEIIAEMNFFNLATDIAKKGGADLINYVTTVVDHGRTHTVQSNDLSDAAYQAHLGELETLLEHP